MDSIMNSSFVARNESRICDYLPFTVNMVSYVATRGTLSTTVLSCVFNGLTLPFTLIANILVFVAVLRKLELRTVHNTSILFLAATDLLVASIAQPAFVVYQGSKLQESSFSCEALAVYTSTVFICTGLSILTLIFITLERYFAIFYPFKYQHLVTTERTVFLIVVVWILWVIFISLVRFTPGTTTSTLSIIASILILTSILITVFVYYKVQKLVIRNRRTISASTSGVSETSGEDSRRRRSIPETKTSRTAAWLTGSLVLCLLPTLITSSVFQAKVTNNVTLYHVIYPLTDTAILLNSTLNPFIYVFRSESIRRSIREIFRRSA
ncbi:histamine H2 receptor-like [Actinia tenebrosa]|uniref:Histamine H2 receptor-like n=1 Tax=Actinia tenebrosa TaxID=6105 RepID=A0A6P8IJT6_ACTTE|nr:histamine H2 receptor-like [Actinia tenebrosa]